MSNKPEDKELEQQSNEQERNELLQYAVALGMKGNKDFSYNAGIDKLKEAITNFEAKLAEENRDKLAALEEELKLKASSKLPDYLELTAPPNETKTQRKIRIRKNNTQLVRVKVTCMNPDKSKWKGEVISFMNAFCDIKKFIPFGSKVPYHVPLGILKVMQDRTYTQHYTVKDQYNRDINKSRQAEEFSIKYFDPLSEEEFNKIHQEQRARAATEADEE